jgi:predicted nucleic acid-binding Zn ribbon protein
VGVATAGPTAPLDPGDRSVNRRAPRPAASALQAALKAAAPKTRLAAVQAAWIEAVGEQIAAAAEPVAERKDEVEVSCSDPVWAQELDLMQEQLLDRLRQRLGEQAPRKLRFLVKEQ